MPARRLCVALTALLAMCIGLAEAGAFAVNPVRLSLSKGRTASALTVQNQGVEAAVIQLESMAWSQQDGADVLVPTQDLIATPPIFRLAAGGSQIVRVGLRGPPPDARREGSYRLVLKEVPPPPPPDTQGIRVALQISLPVFTEPATAMPALRWEARYREGQLRLSAFNDGNLHVQVIGLGLPGAGRQPEIKPGYVLSGQHRDWLFAADAPGDGLLRLVAQTDAGDVAANVPVIAP